jgi:phosphatidylglycerol---prolipoprotein diacylglyceryl transferase
MSPILLTLWGPFSIHAYGVCIAIGIVIALWLLSFDQKAQRLMSQHDLTMSLQYMVLGGYLGGRIVCMLNEDHGYKEYGLLLKFWEPGFSIMGTIIGIIIATFLYLWYKKIPFLSYADRIAIYAPLVQSFGRVGCFFAGCCYGEISSYWWAVMYTDPEHMAPLGISLHPTQLYSSTILFLIFLFLYYYLQRIAKQPGIILCSYLMLVSAERFLVDFWRWDRTWWATSGYLSYLSTNQWIAAALCFCAAMGIIILTYYPKYPKKNYGSI